MTLSLDDQESPGRRLFRLARALGRRQLRFRRIAAPPRENPHFPPIDRRVGRQSDMRLTHQFEMQPVQRMADPIGELCLKLGSELEQQLDIRGMHAERVLVRGVDITLFGLLGRVTHLLCEVGRDRRSGERGLGPAAKHTLQVEADLAIQVLQLLQHTRIIRYRTRTTRGTQVYYSV